MAPNLPQSRWRPYWPHNSCYLEDRCSRLGGHRLEVSQSRLLIGVTCVFGEVARTQPRPQQCSIQFELQPPPPLPPIRHNPPTVRSACHEQAATVGMSSDSRHLENLSTRRHGHPLRQSPASGSSKKPQELGYALFFFYHPSLTRPPIPAPCLPLATLLRHTVIKSMTTSRHPSPLLPTSLTR